MIIEGKIPEEKINLEEINPAKVFGRGIHLIYEKDAEEYKLLVIRNEELPFYWLSGNGGIQHDTGRITWGKFYVYIKKLGVDELVVKLEE